LLHDQWRNPNVEAQSNGELHNGLIMWFGLSFGFRHIDPNRIAGVIWSMERFSIIMGLLFMIAPVFAEQPSSGAETGIEGVITISPAQPGPSRVDAPSSKPLANTAFVVENEKGEVASFTTDDQGRFRTLLAPGHYQVSLKGRKSTIGRFGPFEADVASGKMTKVQWECDSGIR
jgi:hypothetical protein